MFRDEHWPRAAEWIESDGRPGGLGIVGAPLRLGSITPGRCDLAPHAVRKSLLRFSTFDFTSDMDLRFLPVKDYGDVAVAEKTPEEAFGPLRDAVAAAVAECQAVVVLGGDNAVTRPGVHGMGRVELAGLLTIDAHLDLRHLDGGLNNGNPIRALLADGLPGCNIVQVGIQSFANSGEYARVAREEAITVVTNAEGHRNGLEHAVQFGLSRLSDLPAIYIDLDLDVMDRIHAPGTPGSRPGGFTPWEIRKVARLCGRHPKVRALDLVELDPTNDVAETTTLTAAACVLEFAAGLAERLRP